MKFNKVIREHMESVLTDKRLAANKEARAEYDAKVKACAAEVEEIIAFAREQVVMTLVKHEMDMEVKRWGDIKPAAEVIVFFDRMYIQNSSEANKLKDAEYARYEHQQQEMKRIELEAVLGADRDAFFKMLEEVRF